MYAFFFSGKVLKMEHQEGVENGAQALKHSRNLNFISSLVSWAVKGQEPLRRLCWNLD